MASFLNLLTTGTQLLLSVEHLLSQNTQEDSKSRLGFFLSPGCYWNLYILGGFLGICDLTFYGDSKIHKSLIQQSNPQKPQTQSTFFRVDPGHSWHSWNLIEQPQVWVNPESGLGGYICPKGHLWHSHKPTNSKGQHPLFLYRGLSCKWNLFKIREFCFILQRVFFILQKRTHHRVPCFESQISPVFTWVCSKSAQEWNILF